MDCFVSLFSEYPRVKAHKAKSKILDGAGFRHVINTENRLNELLGILTSTVIRKSRKPHSTHSADVSVAQDFDI